jgi:hypothetical protein
MKLRSICGSLCGDRIRTCSLQVMSLISRPVPLPRFFLRSFFTPTGVSLACLARITDPPNTAVQPASRARAHYTVPERAVAQECTTPCRRGPPQSELVGEGAGSARGRRGEEPMHRANSDAGQLSSQGSMRWDALQRAK